MNETRGVFSVLAMEDTLPPLRACEGADGGSPLAVSSVGLSMHSSLFAAAPRVGRFLDLIDALRRHARSGSCSPNQTHTDGGDGRYCTLETVDALCDASRAVLEAEGALLDIRVAQSETLVVVGDIHGQFHDLLTHILSEQSDPALNTDGRDRTFLFLGDFVDRGPNAVEVVMLLLALKVEYPQRIFLTRGNHETPHTSRIYGFFHEVCAKFGSDAPWVRFNEIFCYLPLAAVVTTPTRRFFGSHGGLSPPLTESVDIIKTIERSDYGSALDNVLSDVVDGLLWSDPSDTDANYARNIRGCGYSFGPSASQEFCRQNGFDFICRAHELVMDGYSWTHDGKVLTVFSAPNYCGFNNNLGAVMRVQPSDSENELHFKQYRATEGEGMCAPPPKPLADFIFDDFINCGQFYDVEEVDTSSTQ